MSHQLVILFGMAVKNEIVSIPGVGRRRPSASCCAHPTFVGAVTILMTSVRLFHNLLRSPHASFPALFWLKLVSATSLGLRRVTTCSNSVRGHGVWKENYCADFDQVVQERFALAAEVSEPQLVSCFHMFCDRSEHRVCKFCSGPDDFF
jgi:hypothetical protein